MMRNWHKALLGFVCCIFLVAPAFAAQSGSGKGDPARGRVLFNSCVGCHGIPTYRYAYPHFNVPKLGGQHYTYIVSALEEYAHRKGSTAKRNNPTMHAQAASLSEQDIKDLAAFLSQPKP